MAVTVLFRYHLPIVDLPCTFIILGSLLFAGDLIHNRNHGRRLLGGNGVPPPKKKFVWGGGRKRNRPPTIATLNKHKLDFFHYDYYISILYIPILYHKTFIPFHVHADSEEYAILA